MVFKRILHLLPKTFVLCVVLLACAFSLAACSNEPKTAEEQVIALTKALIKDLNAGKFERIYTGAAESFEQTIPLSQLEQMWDECHQKAGTFDSFKEESVTIVGEYLACVVKAFHTNKAVHYQTTYREIDGEFKLYDVMFIFTDDPGIKQAALPKGVVEEDLILGENTKYPLNGKLTLPQNPKGKLPAVVLVHDDGAQDMDSTMYDNKPFRDIAHYLAQNGIAVLRYDKSTYTYADKFEEDFGPAMTIDIETVADAVLAREVLANDIRIDPDKIFVLGHGIGGMYAPMITHKGGYNGMILFAGSPRSYLELKYDHGLYAISLSDYTDEEAEAARAILRAEMAKYNNLRDADPMETLEYTIFGRPAYFYLDMIENPVAPYYQVDLELPVLVLQGTNNFQVYYDNDYEWYKIFFAYYSNATLKLYDGLNHLFMKSTMEKPNFDDYKRKSTVDSKVLKDIADWVKAQ